MAIPNEYYIPAAVGTVVCQEKHRRDKEEKSKARKPEDFSLIFDKACKAVSERSEVLVCKEVSDEQNTNGSTTGLVYKR